VGELLSPRRVADSGLLDPAAMRRLVTKFESSGGVGETDEMALVGSLSLLLLHERLVERPVEAAPAEPNRVVDGDEVVGAAAYAGAA
jgi:hypothetical protein